MTTIKQMAKELGVSKQAVYNRITKEPLKTTLANLKGAVHTSSHGTIYLSDEGADILRNAYEEKYRRPGEAGDGFGRPYSGEYNKSMYDNILAQLSSTQESLTQLTEHTMAKDARIDSLHKQLTECAAKAMDDTKTIKQLTDLAAAKDAEIKALQDSNNAQSGQITALQAQIALLESELIVGDSNEPGE